MNLREQLLKSKDSVKKAIKVPFQVRKDRKTLESWIIDSESNIADLELEIVDGKAKEKLDVNAILESIDKLELEERRLEQGEDLLKELFETEVKE